MKFEIICADSEDKLLDFEPESVDLVVTSPPYFQQREYTTGSLGSGSTMVAAILEGRSCIGIDISEEYCHSAQNRVSQTLDKLALAEAEGNPALAQNNEALPARTDTDSFNEIDIPAQWALL